MKIRFQRGSVRFRLRQGDLRTLVSAGRTEETVSLGGRDLVHALELHDGPAAVTLDGARFVARLPATDAHAWAESDAVGLDYALAGGTRLLVEKDWACLEPAPGETNDGTFARPEPIPANCRTP